MMLFQEETEVNSCGGVCGDGSSGGIGDSGGRGLMRPAGPQDSPYGLLPEPVVVLHSLHSSE